MLLINFAAEIMGRKRKIIENVFIETIAAEGKCLGKINGQAVFVAGVAPGDVVDLKIIKRKKNYLEGRVIRFREYSKERIEPFCEHFGLCGGCKWQHIPYPLQAAAKRQQIIDHFSRIGKFPFPEVNDIVTPSKTTQYRNKLEYTFSNKRWLTQEEIDTQQEIDRDGVGFHIPGQFDKVVDIHECHLQEESTNEIRNALRTFARESGMSFYDISQNKGLLRNLVIRMSTLGQLMIIVQFGERDEKNALKVMDFLQKEFPQIDSLYYVVNLKKNETFHDQELILHSGRAWIEEKIGDLTFRIGPKSFFQTNTEQTERLYTKAMEMAQLSGTENVYDLYCGTGTIACYAAKNSQKVIGIESIGEAIDDARTNAEINGLDNTVFITGDVREIMNDEFFMHHGRPDVIITDPPRAGMHPDVVEAILEATPRRIVYVSCNPASQARDLKALTTHYIIEEVQPFDMFPHTHHLENIVSLKCKS